MIETHRTAAGPCEPSNEGEKEEVPRLGHPLCENCGPYDPQAEGVLCAACAAKVAKGELVRITLELADRKCSQAVAAHIHRGYRMVLEGLEQAELGPLARAACESKLVALWHQDLAERAKLLRSSRVRGMRLRILLLELVQQGAVDEASLVWWLRQHGEPCAPAVDLEFARVPTLYLLEALIRWRIAQQSDLLWLARNRGWWSGPADVGLGAEAAS